MAKKYYVGYGCNEDNASIALNTGKGFDTYEAASEKLARSASVNGNKDYHWLILESVAYAKIPVPNVEIVKY